MTDAVRYLDAGIRRHDEVRLKANDSDDPERDIKLDGTGESTERVRTAE
jgi:hypothetical protein